ncbi:hypothetical protein QMK33_19220 [Hymenobacter sp. H14-R3]|uniref:hypothetical protein n=1 Tax=Hymenobacter sp. H14-R3 TaxID=3046308 RepID=UPI0024BB25C7|nr:hypothetical protein [Hymenobacter sp. H14-R3]MDJ0367284.1 hypothetical protein [Hymenobacter sp. H14-R3]
MKALIFLLLTTLLTGCATTAFEPSAQAPRRARHYYQHQQRRHAHERRRAPQPFLPWN